jgi:MbtH protein
MPDASDDRSVHKVLVNHEGQYSLWLADREAPAGWTEVGKPGSKEECLAYIEEVWTDMRPLSLRQAADPE